MNENQLAASVDVLLAQRQQLLRPHAGQEWREHQRPVSTVHVVEVLACLLGRLPAALRPRSRGLQASVGRVNARSKRGVGLDAVLTQCVAQNRGEAADGPVDGRLRQTSLEERGVDVMQMLSGYLVERPVWTVRQMGVDVLGDPVLVGLHGPWIASEARGPDAHPLAKSQSVGRDKTLVQLGDELFGGAPRWRQ